MIFEERKQLGVNKSTLWDVKNNLRDKKNVKICSKILTKLI